VIQVTDIINARLRGKLSGKLRGTSEHLVNVKFTGRATLDGLARSVEANGNATLAAQLRRAKSFTLKMTAAKWAEINGERPSVKSASVPSVPSVVKNPKGSA
jgi:predicted nucleic acid-binding Zn ribbon protein